MAQQKFFELIRADHDFDFVGKSRLLITISVILVVLSFAIALPQAPAGVGVVQLASETTLTALYGMPAARAQAFAIGLWVCQVGIVVGAGLVALWAEGLSFADVRQAQSVIGAFEAKAAD